MVGVQVAPIIFQHTAVAVAIDHVRLPRLAAEEHLADNHDVLATQDGTEAAALALRLTHVLAPGARLFLHRRKE